mmetsp:Transcript_80758/g.118471  ORF Transcript_80758/g.118471 Transcript_80758/m.118471 type:complete len:127 (-) Transcript_80758:339-719(-)
MYVCKCMCMYMYIYVQVCMNMYIYTCICAHICVYTRIHAHMQMHTHTCTHTHTRTHTHKAMIRSARRWQQLALFERRVLPFPTLFPRVTTGKNNVQERNVLLVNLCKAPSNYSGLAKTFGADHLAE